MTTQLTIPEAMKHYGVSERTIRRWIKSGKVKAEIQDGKYFIFVDLSETPDTDKTDDKLALIEQLQAENAHLRDQLSEKDSQLQRRDEQNENLQKLLAIQTQTNAQLTDRLTVIEDNRQRSWWQRLLNRP